ncbi:MAG: YbaB/EbfC family nucleoid-associated protein [Bacteroidota bacterium]|nr:YbaB/EbfC family nucleoid-associated protein [Bacteroidota bacterium]MDE2957513.1 YbaB/EbfC family nucleoid-associated protein [Bacteroidota bacterium]
MGKFNMADLFGKVSSIQQQIAVVQKNLARIQVSAEVGGGMVRVTATGTQRIVDIEFEPEVVNPDDVELLRELVIAGVNRALEESARKQKEEMQSVAGGLLPPGMDASQLGV